MSRNPVVNALCALGYIGFVVTLMHFMSQTLGNKPDTAFAPVAFLSMLTLSASVMGYLFFYQPLQLLIEGKKKEALDLFVKTVSVFAAFTTIVLILLFLRVI